MPARPPFTGIHEVLPRSGGGVPHEGGGKLPLFGEDLFQRIVDINFGGGGAGGVFTSGDYCCYIRSGYAPVALDEHAWIGIGAPVFTHRGSCTGGAAAVIDGRPTFLLAGGNSDGGAVALSHDGLNYVQTYGLASQGPSGAPYMASLIWDAGEQTFYGLTRGYIGETYKERVYISKDGYDWALTTLPRLAFYGHSQNPFGEPDGVVGYNPDSDTWIRPEDLDGLQVEGMMSYYEYTYGMAVAFADGIWIGTGGAYIDDYLGGGYVNFANYYIASLDDGASWTLVAYGDLGGYGDYGNAAMLGIALAHFGDISRESYVR